MADINGCNECNKASLSLLFLRPSPIAKSRELAVTGSEAVVSDMTLLTGLLPAKLPTQSRFALRLLRPGYIHIYIEHPPTGVKNWLLYRITEQADVIPQGNDLFGQPNSGKNCSAKGHNAMGLKLVNIPQAHKISDIWVAFSANIWNENIRARNKANSSVMQKISLQSCGVNSFTPSAANLRGKVLECALGKMVLADSEEHDFSFNSVSISVEKLAENLKQAAARHPRTLNKEMAIVLNDPVGIAAELNALRIHRNELIKKEIAKPENAHPINSSNTILGLRRSLVSEEEVNSFEQITPIRTKEAFLKEQWPPGTEWQQLTAADRKMLLSRTMMADGCVNPLLSPYNKLFSRTDLGRVFYGDNDRRAADWTKEKVEKNWSKLSRYYDENERATWMKNFESRMKSSHYEPLKLFEQDWRAAAEDKITLSYFKNHFDPKQIFNALSSHNPNLAYCIESHVINTPAPFSGGAILESYANILKQDVKDENSISLRAILGNQAEMIDQIAVQLTGNPGKEGMRDKTYDVFKGVSELNFSKAAMASHGWISAAMAMYSMGHVVAVCGAVFSVAATMKPHGLTMPAMMARLATLSKVQRFMEFAAEGALKSNVPKMPLLVTMMIDVEEALEIFDKRRGQGTGASKTRIKAHRGGSNKIAISVLTDTEAYKAANGNISAITHDASSGSVKMGASHVRVEVASAVGSATIMSQEKLLLMYQGQAGAGAKVANLIRSNVLHANAVLGTIDARLAIGAMIIQTIGIWNARESAMKAKDSDESFDAYLGMLDSGLGFLGGAVQLWGVAVEATIGRVAADKSMKLLGLRVIGGIAGVLGGIVNFVISMRSSEKQENNHNYQSSQLYFYAAIAFSGTGATSAALTVGTIAGALETRAIGGAVVRTIATRLAANAVVGTVGGVGLTVSGIGIVLLGAGIVFQVGAIVLTPTDLQRWLGRSYFGRDGGILFSGKRDDMFAKGDWNSEKSEFEKLMMNSDAVQSPKLTNSCGVKPVEK
jgi:hypothetical protein